MTLASDAAHLADVLAGAHSAAAAAVDGAWPGTPTEPRGHVCVRIPRQTPLANRCHAARRRALDTGIGVPPELDAMWGVEKTPTHWAWYNPGAIGLDSLRLRRIGARAFADALREAGLTSSIREEAG